MSNHTAAAIAVLGAINEDHTFHVRQLPLTGQTVLANRMQIDPGGKGRNQAVSAAQLGAEVVMIGAVGADESGDKVLADLAVAGVSGEFVARHQAAPTGNALIVVDDEGSNVIVVHQGANALISMPDIEALGSVLRRQAALICSLEVPLEAVSCALGLAARYGLTTILNAAPADPLDGADLRMALADVDVLVVNEGEGRRLFGLVPDADRADLVKAASVLLVDVSCEIVITLGGEGALLVTRNGCSGEAPYLVESSNTVGAGDAFVGALGVLLAEGEEMQQALAFAAAAGAQAVRSHGRESGGFSRADVDLVMKNAKRGQLPASDEYSAAGGPTDSAATEWEKHQS